MSNTVPNEIVELVDNYRESGKPELALRLQKIIPTLSAKEKEAIAAYLSISSNAEEKKDGNNQKRLNFSAFVLRLKDKIAIVDKSNFNLYVVKDGAEKINNLHDMAEIEIVAEVVSTNDSGVVEIDIK